MSLETVWREALSYIEMKVPNQVYDTWFTPGCSGSEPVLVSEFLQYWVNSGEGC